jgi:hypothetical protein
MTTFARGETVSSAAEEVTVLCESLVNLRAARVVRIPFDYRGLAVARKRGPSVVRAWGAIARVAKEGQSDMASQG